MLQELIFTNIVGETVDRLAASLGNPRAVVIADTNTARLVLPVLKADSATIAGADVIEVPAGDINKDLNSLTDIWNRLSRLQATRSTLVINVGGGVVTDLGGFAAATFKRGLRIIHIPTTLLGAVDASYGGKTGINFDGFKNLVGVFAEPVATIISTIYFNTLPEQEILSGYAEMLKHALLDSGRMLSDLLGFSPVYPVFDSERLLPLLQESVAVKKRIADSDPREQGPRKALNLGHTIGHAIEAVAFAASSPVPHGYAVAWGLVTELVLSHLQLGFPSDILHSVAQYIRTNYGGAPFTCDDYPALLKAMRQDKKNISTEINFTLLRSVGDPVTDCTASDKDICAALDIFRDLMGE